MKEFLVIEYHGITSYKVTLVYLVGHPLRMYHFGKTWAKTTQCLIFLNGLLVSSGEVVKHEKDIDNPEYAIKAATKKAIPRIPFKDMRKEIWQLIDKKLKENKVW